MGFIQSLHTDHFTGRWGLYSLYTHTSSLAGRAYTVFTHTPSLAGGSYPVFTHTPLHWRVGHIQSLHTHPFTGGWVKSSLYSHTPSLAGGSYPVFTHTPLHWRVGQIQSLHTHPFTGRWDKSSLYVLLPTSPHSVAGGVYQGFRCPLFYPRPLCRMIILYCPVKGKVLVEFGLPCLCYLRPFPVLSWVFDLLFVQVGWWIKRETTTTAWF